LKTFESSWNTEEFNQLNYLALKAILSSDNLVVPSENTVFHALATWVEYDASNRSCYLSKLLPLIRLAWTTSEYLFSVINGNSILKYLTVEEQVKYYNEAMFILGYQMSSDIKRKLWDAAEDTFISNLPKRRVKPKSQITTFIWELSDLQNEQNSEPFFVDGYWL